MAYRICDIDLSEPPPAIQLAPGQDGLALVARWRGDLVGFVMAPSTPGATWSERDVHALAQAQFARSLVYRQAATALAARRPPSDLAPPSLTIAICTKDRAVRLARLLTSLTAVCTRHGFAALEILVVDNASQDDATQRAVQGFEGVRYLREPKPGLDFARNAALGAAAGDLLAFLDDDVVVDRNWLDGLLAAWRRQPGAGGFTGLVLPFRLDTPAQVYFESHGGFGRGFRPATFNAARWGDDLYPVGAGILGAGCNMCFDRALLAALGGFDEALDTGAPLPGGGDLDIFYRVLRSGRAILYEPQYAVYHEHRETLSQLNRQYWSWGLGFMAFLVKCGRADPALRSRHRAMLRWWVFDKAAALARALRRGRWREVRFTLAEVWGAIQGFFGEYDRSRERVAIIRAPNP